MLGVENGFKHPKPLVFQPLLLAVNFLVPAEFIKRLHGFNLVFMLVRQTSPYECVLWRQNRDMGLDPGRDSRSPVEPGAAGYRGIPSAPGERRKRSCCGLPPAFSGF